MCAYPGACDPSVCPEFKPQTTVAEEHRILVVLADLCNRQSNTCVSCMLGVGGTLPFGKSILYLIFVSSAAEKRQVIAQDDQETAV